MARYSVKTITRSYGPTAFGPDSLVEPVDQPRSLGGVAAGGAVGPGAQRAQQVQLLFRGRRGSVSAAAESAVWAASSACSSSAVVAARGRRSVSVSLVHGERPRERGWRGEQGWSDWFEARAS